MLDFATLARLRVTFDEIADLYDQARPGYPEPVIAQLSRVAGLNSHSRILEVGCGTGQATRSLAALGCLITAVELGGDLARVAAARLAVFDKVRVENARFEEWNLPDERFDMVLSASAFHLLNPYVRIAKPADALHAGGTLGILQSYHVPGGTEEFFNDLNGCYSLIGQEPNEPIAHAAIPDNRIEIDASPLFGDVRIHCHEWEHDYTTDQYIALLRTFSDHRVRSIEERQILESAIRELIDDVYAGSITKRYLTQLQTARRV